MQPFAESHHDALSFCARCVEILSCRSLHDLLADLKFLKDVSCSLALPIQIAWNVELSRHDVLVNSVTCYAQFLIALLEMKSQTGGKMLSNKVHLAYRCSS